MVSCPGVALQVLSPRPPTTGGLRGIAKHVAATSRFPDAKAKKVQRALCFDYQQSPSSSFFLARHARRIGVMHPALSRLRAQDSRDTPKMRQATPIKDKQLSMYAAYGRHSVQGDLDSLADELGTCQLQSALKAAAAQRHQAGAAPAPMLADGLGACQLQPAVVAAAQVQVQQVGAMAPEAMMHMSMVVPRDG
ncbi:hypothetical protein TSOC_012109 [Tetrabaena socialis]|uniref:Uncharacterized protein n=1 Tax=Tetrabaena socialis TaxID=47790 RepID=A0A2J7ZNX0_9CHLO|nr:hypothetical protein TSOC_012109 [Tetrabaena socialis]|eukprot:PNH01950.1 hypothetical protein TSOC_012109 [Tetrabaena socialis]